MKRLTALLLVLALAACGSPAAAPSASASVAAASPTPTPTAAATTPAPTATTSALASATLIPLPNVAQLSAPSATVVWALVANTRLFLSTDRGDTWKEQKPPALTSTTLLSFIDDHEGWLAALGAPTASCQTQLFALSHTADAGATWSPLTVTGIPPAQCKNNLAFRDATNGLVAASDGTTAPVVYRTTDGGRTWSVPVKVNKTPNGTLAFTPAVDVLPNGTVAVTYYDLRHNTPNPNTLLADNFVVHSHNGGQTWSEARLTPHSFNLDTAPFARGLFLGDYQGLAHTTGAFQALFVRTNNSLNNRTDVFSTRITP